MDYKKIIWEALFDSIDLKYEFFRDDRLTDKIIEVIKEIANCFNQGNKILIAGNGGSAAECEHMAGEFVSKFLKQRKALPAIALSSNASIMTSVANDFDFQYVFRRGLEAFYEEGDLFICFTTSGNSRNVIQALKYCQERNIRSICFNGGSGGVITKKNLADFEITVPSYNTARIQEIHLFLIHLICYIIESEMTECKL